MTKKTKEMELASISRENFTKHIQLFNKQHYIFCEDLDITRATIAKNRKEVLEKMSSDGIVGELELTCLFIADKGDNIYIFFDKNHLDIVEARKILTNKYT
ncbi:hypothetical protein HJ204_06130 [Vibrio parahaemolyticus]|nr:hypothetical protein [Vibrio parahaemolyticus]